MALPAHLSRFDGLVDLVVEALVAQWERGADVETAGGPSQPPAVDQQQQDQQRGKTTGISLELPAA